MSLEPLVTAFERATQGRSAVRRLDELGRPHRRQGERFEQGKHDSGRHGDAELVEEFPDDALHERDRQEDRDQRDGRSHRGKRDLARACEYYAGAMAVRYTTISIRDQKSRWGSCAASGTLSFSWRLIMAPDFVLDYVAAHEVAHLREMNHGPGFWRLVLSHCKSARAAKVWLKAHGRDLHLVG